MHDNTLDEALLDGAVDGIGNENGSSMCGSTKRLRRSRSSNRNLVKDRELVRLDLVLNQTAAQLDLVFRLANKNKAGTARVGNATAAASNATCVHLNLAVNRSRR